MHKICCLLLLVTISLLAAAHACRPVQNDDEIDNSPIKTQLETLQVAIKNGQAENALAIFKKVEPRLERGVTLYKGWLYFALHATDARVRTEYANKFLDTRSLPPEIENYQVQLYRQLAFDAQEHNNLTLAKEWLTRAATKTTETPFKIALESEIVHLQSIGKPIKPLSADTWFNPLSTEFSMELFKGKPVLLVFRATWSEPCRSLTPLLKELSEQYKDNNLVVVDVFKLYGSYKDELEYKEKVSATEEVALLQQYCLRHQILYPVAVCYEGIPFETYQVTAIPTLFFINKEGIITAVEIGAAAPQKIKKNIIKILEGK